LTYGRRKGQGYDSVIQEQVVDDELCLFGCKERETVEHFVTKQVIRLLGVQMTGTNDLDSGKHLLGSKREMFRR
jgi:hypothetical protein